MGSVSLKYLLLFFICHITLSVQGQILFSKSTFKGGVTTCGSDNVGIGSRKCIIKWKDDYTLKTAYAITYRYGRPKKAIVKINEGEIEWNMSNQIGSEQYEIVDTYFAPHAQDVTDLIEIYDDTIHMDFLPQNWPGEIGSPNEGYWGVYVVILYEAPSITEKICNQIYIADQSQIMGQHYKFDLPYYLPNTPVLFALHASRLTGVEGDQTIISINNQIIGEVNGPDLVIPYSNYGSQGHYYYENKNATGTNGDSATNFVNDQDAIAVINEYLNPNNNQQELYLNRVIPGIGGYGGFNPHPSFNITYTPTCSLPEVNNMQRTYETCHQQSSTGDILNPITLQAIPGYDHYAWTPAKGLSDSTIANPICTADSSRWYRVSMWNDDGDVCDQTIPVFVTVNPVPRPIAVKIKPSVCPSYTGQIDLKQPAGKGPFEYFLNGEEQPNGTFTKLPPGSYNVSIQSAAGCAWDSTIVIPLEPVQKAAFTANPDSGYTPLRVVFLNKSEFADGYTWLINDEEFSTNKNMVHTFDEPGTYEVALVAYRQEESCTDTAFVTIKVYQGLSLIIPNIITPNNDGRNDALVVQTAGVEYMRWEVFNRWGNSLHSGAANHPPAALSLWNPEPNTHSAGTYTVVITARGESGEVRQIVEQVVVRSTED